MPQESNLFISSTTYSMDYASGYNRAWCVGFDDTYSSASRIIECSKDYSDYGSEYENYRYSVRCVRFCAADEFWNGSECAKPCNPNPCPNDEHSDGICTPTGTTTYECGCLNDTLGNYMWYDGECRQIVTRHQCQMFAESVLGGIPDYVTDVVDWVCHCSDDQCVITWEP